MNITTDAPELRNPSVESWLESQGVGEAMLGELSLASIDVKASHRNQARAVPVEVDVAKAYAASMNAGATLPPIIVRRTPTSKCVVIDGNTRVAAAEIAKVGTIPAYIIECNDVRMSIMTATANAVNGRTNTPAERRQHALMLLGMGLTAPQVATALQINSATVNRFRKEASALGRAHRTSAKVGGDVLCVLDRIQMDSVLVAALEMAEAASWSEKEAPSKVAEIMGYKSESEQLACVERMSEEHARQSRAKATTSRRSSSEWTKMVKGLGTMCALQPTLIAQSVQADDVTEVKARIDAAVSVLTEIRRQL